MSRLTDRLKGSASGGAIILLGPPGSGKSTQARLLAEKFEFRLISSGDLVRKAMEEEETERGELFRSIYAKGALVPDNLMFPLFKEAVGETVEGLVIDGFPRTREQAEALALIIPVIQRVILMEMAMTLAGARVMARQRDQEDSATIVYERMLQYLQETTPVADYYLNRKMLSTVPAIGTVEEVNERILLALVSRSTSLGVPRRVEGAPTPVPPKSA